MKKLLVLIFILIGMITFSKNVKSTVIFADGFESGDFSAWTDTAAGPASTIEVVTTQKYNGLYGAHSIAPIYTWFANVYSDIGNYDTLYAQWYVRFVNLPSNGKYMRIWEGREDWTGIVNLRVLNDDGTLKLWLDQEGTDQHYAYDFQVGTWYFIVVKRHKAVNGEYQVWLDGNEVISYTGVDTSANYINKLLFGISYSNEDLRELYFDDIVISDEYIHLNRTISGKLVNKTGDVVQANIIGYQNGTSVIVNSNQTDSGGNYLLTLLLGVYDISYKILNFIPNFFIKLLSLNVVSDIKNKVNYFTAYDSNKISFTVDVTDSQTIQIYSETEPTKVLINGTEIKSVSSLSDLQVNKWFYNSSDKNLYVMGGLILPNRCVDGTISGKCSPTKPKYCDDGNLIDKCTQCGCDSGYECQPNGLCTHLCGNDKIDPGEDCETDADCTEENYTCVNCICVLQGLPKLHVEGTLIKDSSGKRIKLVGFNGHLYHLESWAYQIFEEDTEAFGGAGLPAWVTSGYTDLLQCARDFWSGNGNGAYMQEKYIEHWQWIASRYSGKNVIFAYDLFNEPHNPFLGGDWTFLEPLANYSRDLFERTILAIRTVDPDTIIIVDALTTYDDDGGASLHYPINQPNVMWGRSFYDMSSRNNYAKYPDGNVPQNLRDILKGVVTGLYNKFVRDFNRPFFLLEISTDDFRWNQGSQLWFNDTMQFFSELWNSPYELSFTWWRYSKDSSGWSPIMWDPPENPEAILEPSNVTLVAFIQNHIVP